MLLCTLINKPYNDTDFIEWLIPHIRNYILFNIDLNKVKQFNKLFNKRFNNNNIDTYKIIYYCANHIEYRIVKDKIILYINTNIPYNLFKVNINTLCKIINYGDLNTMAYPIFTNAFKHITANLTSYYEEYIEE